MHHATIILLPALALLACAPTSSPPEIQGGPMPADVPLYNIERSTIVVGSITFSDRSLIYASVSLDTPSSSSECPFLANPEEWSLIVNHRTFPLQDIGGVSQYPPTPTRGWSGLPGPSRTWHCNDIGGKIEGPHGSYDTAAPLVLGIGHAEARVNIEVRDAYRVRRWTWPGPAEIAPGGMTVIEYEGPALESFIEPFTEVSASLAYEEGPEDLDWTWDVSNLGGGRFGLIAPSGNPSGVYFVNGLVTVALPVECSEENACSTPYLPSPQDPQLLVEIPFGYTVTVQ